MDELGIELVVAVGEGARPYMRGAGPPAMHWLPTRPRSTASPVILQPGDAILVKASRAVGLEGIPASIEKRARAWSES